MSFIKKQMETPYDHLEILKENGFHLLDETNSKSLSINLGKVALVSQRTGEYVKAVEDGSFYFYATGSSTEAAIFNFSSEEQVTVQDGSKEIKDLFLNYGSRSDSLIMYKDKTSFRVYIKPGTTECIIVAKSPKEYIWVTDNKGSYKGKCYVLSKNPTDSGIIFNFEERT